MLDLTITPFQVYSGVRSLQKKSGKNKASQGTSADASEATGTISTFDDVRYQEFKKKTSVLLLAPTSYSVREGHIRRWWYLYKLLSTLLSKSRYINMHASYCKYD